ncbi:MAG: HYR domain-containing protein, partial [Saprospiraceae bacterium]|nr:HYR domain-containing protein [Saprospiraceae bacterium]
MKKANSTFHTSLLSLLMVVFALSFSVNASAQCSLVCNNLVQVSLDQDCEAELHPDDILEGGGCPNGNLQVQAKINNVWVPASGNFVATSANINQTLQIRVRDLNSGNMCWGNALIQDKLAPIIACTNITLNCAVTNYTPGYILNTLNIAAAYPTVDENCGNATLTFIDTWNDVNCTGSINGVTNVSAYVLRKWTAVDQSGNSATCNQYIYFKRKNVSSVLFPANYSTDCENPVTTPAAAGVPYIAEFGLEFDLYPNNTFCELSLTYTDQVLPVCDGTYKILRTWTVLDWCLPTSAFPPNQNPVYYIQLIKVEDTTGPQFDCPEDLTVSTNPNGCCAVVNLPDAIIEDNCSRINNISAMVTTFDPYTGEQTGMYTVGGSLTSFPGNNLWDLDTLGNWASTTCLPVGTHRVVYTAEDDCGNTSTCSFRLTVNDEDPPTAACDEFTVVGIGLDDPFDCYKPSANGCTGAGVTWVKAKTFDDGSYDNCNNLKFTVRRMAPYSDCINNLEDCEKPRATEEQDSIKFYCCEVGTTQTVILRVYQVDLNGNIMFNQYGEAIYNECMVQVEVQDKVRPTCVPPINVTVSCENFDPSLWAYGKPQVDDNCCLDATKVYQDQCGLTHTVNLSLFDTVCNKGTITRTFRAFDCHGQSSQCTQRVVVNYEQDYFVRFPNDVIVSVCDGTGNYGAPTFFGEDCELLGVSFQDEVFTVVPDACFKIERTWTVINWCTYNPNQPCIFVPNPNPNAITNNPANLPGVVVSPLGTLAPWNPTVVKINPTDATATNYSVFYNANANCYQYKQIIKVIDTQDPAVTCPASPVEYCDLTPNDPQLWNQMYWWDNVISSHDLCEGEADLTLTATDACSGSNISFRYLLFLDLDGDNVMETVVSSTNLPGVNNVQFGNAGNANYTGGQAREFDGRPVPFNQKWRFGLDWTTSGTSATAKVRFDNLQSPIALPGTGNNAMQGVVPQLPYGTHKIKWFVEDGCGNESICEYTFVVKDCKKPTVVCLNGLSV